MHWLWIALIGLGVWLAVGSALGIAIGRILRRASDDALLP